MTKSAFPHPDIHIPQPDGPMIKTPASTGMSLRDWFAGQAINGLLAADVGDNQWESYGAMVERAWDIADRMMSKRSAKSTPPVMEVISGEEVAEQFPLLPVNFDADFIQKLANEQRNMTLTAGVLVAEALEQCLAEIQSLKGALLAAAPSYKEL